MAGDDDDWWRDRPPCVQRELRCNLPMTVDAPPIQRTPRPQLLQQPRVRPSLTAAAMQLDHDPGLRQPVSTSSACLLHEWERGGCTGQSGI